MATGKALSVKITGDNKEFDAALQKSAAETRRFAQQQKKQAAEIKRGMEHLKSAVTGVGAALGAAFATREFFDRFTNSTQITSDNFGRSMEEMKTMADSFFSSVNNNNFNGFLSRLAEIRQAARNAFDAEDILADMKLSDTVIDAQTKAEGDKYKADYKEAKAKGDTEGMKKAQADYSTLMTKYWEETRITQAQTLSTALANTNKYLAQFGLQADEKDILTYATKTNKEDSGLKGIVEDYNKKIAEFDALINANKLTVTGSYGTAGNQGSAIYDTAKSKVLEAQKLAYIEENKFAAIQAKLYNEADAGRQHWFAQLADYYKLESGFQQFRAQGSKMEQGVNNLTIKESKESSKIKVDSAFGNDLIDADPEIPLMLIPTLKPDEWAKVDDWMRRLETDGLIMPISTVIGEAENAPEIKLDAKTNGLESIQSVTGSINSMLGQTAGLLSQSGNDWGAWGMSALGNIASVVGQYASLIAMQMASGVAEQGKLPFPYNIAAMAATAGGIISIIGSLPKFATGGIVPGGSFTGDNVLARVNSGEMILNAAQQSNLFKMINTGSTQRQGAPELVVRGDKLYAVLQNYTKGRSL